MRRRVALALLACAALAAGCSRYVAGSGGAPPFASIDVATATDLTFTPQSRALLGSAVARELAQTGRVDVRDGGADAVLEISLVSLERSPAVGLQGDTGRSDKIELVLTATATLRDLRGSTAYFTDRRFTTRIQVFPGTSQADAEFQEMPVAVRDLARQIARAVTSTW